MVRLVLLGVLFFLEKAVRDLKILHKEASKLPPYTRKHYEARVKLCFHKYSLVTNDIEQAINGLSSPLADMLRSASLDLAVATPWNAYMSQKLEQYEAAGHAGIVCAILIEHLDDGMGDSDPAAIARFIRTRTKFSAQCDSISSRYGFRSSHTRSVLRSQLFIPNKLVQISAIWDAVQNDGRPDCLGRLAWFMRHDAGSRTLAGDESWRRRCDWSFRLVSGIRS